MLRILTPILLMIAVTCNTACNHRTNSDLQIAIANTIATESYVSDFDAIYPEAEHFITYYTEKFGGPRWNSAIDIDARTRLTMQFDINIDSSGHKVTRIDDPQFSITTIESFSALPDGRTVEHHGPGMQFGPKEWQKIVDADGDISVVFPNR